MRLGVREWRNKSLRLTYANYAGVLIYIISGDTGMTSGMVNHLELKRNCYNMLLGM
jgi:hypothetical protein